MKRKEASAREKERNRRDKETKREYFRLTLVAGDVQLKLRGAVVSVTDKRIER